MVRAVSVCASVAGSRWLNYGGARAAAMRFFVAVPSPHSTVYVPFRWHLAIVAGSQSSSSFQY